MPVTPNSLGGARGERSVLPCQVSVYNTHILHTDYINRFRKWLTVFQLNRFSETLAARQTL